MLIPSPDSTPVRGPRWLDNDKALLSHTMLMTLGGYQLAIAMIDELLFYASLELAYGDTAAYGDASLDPPLPYPLADLTATPPVLEHTRDTLYEANLRRFKALDLALSALRAAAANPGLAERYHRPSSESRYAVYPLHMNSARLPPPQPYQSAPPPAPTPAPHVPRSPAAFQSTLVERLATGLRPPAPLTDEGAQLHES